MKDVPTWATRVRKGDSVARRPRLVSSVILKHRVLVSKEPVKGMCCYRKGRLCFIESGSRWIDGRLSNWFEWRLVQKDGSLGRRHKGYWFT